MSGDEYRQVLLAWATEQMPADEDVARILDVRIDYSRGAAWDYTIEDASLEVWVEFEDSRGERQTRMLRADEQDAARSISGMLNQLLALADLRGDEIRAGQTRIASAQATVDARWERMTAGAEVALYLGDERKTEWRSFVEGQAVYMPGPNAVTVDAAVFRTGAGEHNRVLLAEGGRPMLLTPGTELRLERPIVKAVSDV